MPTQNRGTDKYLSYDVSTSSDSFRLALIHPTYYRLSVGCLGHLSERFFYELATSKGKSDIKKTH